MVDKIKYDVVSPEAKVASGEAESILIPGIEGDFTVLSKHASYLSTLRPGILKIFSSGDEKQYFVNSGFAEVSTEGLVILAERAIPHPTERPCPSEPVAASTPFSLGVGCSSSKDPFFP